MNIYDYAMQMEKDGENLYRELAVKSGNAGLGKILTMLADAEVRHYKLFQNMKRNEKVSVPESAILNHVKNIFLQMREAKSFNVDVSQIDLYRQAEEIERKTEEFYRAKAGEVSDKDQTAIFLKIADEEKRHFLVLESIINFVNRPATWLENPEWHHLEEY